MDQKQKTGIRLIFFLVGLITIIFLYRFLFDNENQNKFREKNQELIPEATLKVLYPLDPYSDLKNLDPHVFDPISRQILVNIFEPLVTTDANLNFQPGLAEYWGLIDDQTWEIKLKKDIYFHDGSKLTTSDIFYNFQKYQEIQKNNNEESFDFLAGIEEIIIEDDYSFFIKTKTPDPLLVSKLSLFLIFSEENPQAGTGPYQFSDEKNQLLSFADYHSLEKEQRFKKIEIYFENKEEDRIKIFLNEQIDFLIYPPLDYLEALRAENYNTAQTPSLEVNSLIFNFDSEIFSNLENRKVLSIGINKNSLQEIFGPEIQISNQFVGNGVFGFNPQIATDYDFNYLQKIINENGLKDKEILIFLPQGLNSLGQYLKNNLKNLGLSGEVKYFTSQHYLEAIEAENPDIFFLNYKSDFGDSLDFFTDIVSERGKYHINNYQNPESESMIEAIQTEFNSQKRLLLMQELLEFLVSDEVFGIPLFEYEINYVYTKDYFFEPRIDGLFFYNDLETLNN